MVGTLCDSLFTILYPRPVYTLLRRFPVERRLLLRLRRISLLMVNTAQILNLMRPMRWDQFSLKFFKGFLSADCDRVENFLFSPYGRPWDLRECKEKKCSKNTYSQLILRRENPSFLVGPTNKGKGEKRGVVFRPRSASIGLLSKAYLADLYLRHWDTKSCVGSYIYWNTLSMWPLVRKH